VGSLNAKVPLWALIVAVAAALAVASLGSALAGGGGDGAPDKLRAPISTRGTGPGPLIQRQGKVRYVTATVRNPAGRVTPVAVRCPGNTVAIGGGGGSNGNQPLVNWSASFDLPDPEANEAPEDGWVVFVRNNTSQARPATVTAICAPKSL
jgi:hypothetical protein